MLLGSHDVRAWLDRSAGHQLFRDADGALVYRFLPTSPEAARALLRPSFARLVTALGGPLHPGLPRLLRHEDRDELILAVADVEGWPADRINRMLAPDEALGLGHRVLRALRPLHRDGLFHGALTPSRILLTHGGTPVLYDVGAALMADGQPDQRLSPPVPGFVELYPNPGLVPPEIFHKRPLSPATDVFQVAALTFRWLTGHPAFGAGGRTLAVYARVRDGQHEPFPAVEALADLQLARTLTASLSPAPADRPRPDELERALEPFGAIGLPETRTPGPPVAWSRTFRDLPPEDAPGPPGSPAEIRRQEALRRAALQLDLMRERRPDRRPRSKALLILAALALAALAAIPLLRSTRPALEAPHPATAPPSAAEPQDDPASARLEPPPQDRPTAPPIRFAPPRRRPPQAERPIPRQSTDTPRQAPAPTP